MRCWPNSDRSGTKENIYSKVGHPKKVSLCGGNICPSWTRTVTLFQKENSIKLGENAAATIIVAVAVE